MVLLRFMSFLKNKNVLVTGGSGFVGTNLLKKLLEFDCNLRTTIHNTEPQFKNKKYTKKKPNPFKKNMFTD